MVGSKYPDQIPHCNQNDKQGVPRMIQFICLGCQVERWALPSD